MTFDKKKMFHPLPKINFLKVRFLRKYSTKVLCKYLIVIQLYSE